MHPLDINRVVDSLNQINPALNSIDENLAPIPKMGFWKKWFVRVFHFISWGYCIKNPKLDEIANRVYNCASQTLPKEFEQAQLLKYTQAFATLRDIVKENEGSERAKINQLIDKICNSQLKKPLEVPEPPPRIPSPVPVLPLVAEVIFSIPPPPVSAPPPVEPAPVKQVHVHEEPLPTTVEGILELVITLDYSDPRLPALAAKLASDDQLTGKLIAKYDSAIGKLFSCKEDISLKVVVAERLLRDGNSYGVLRTYFSVEVWEQVAKRWPLEIKVDAYKSPLSDNLEGILAFIHILTERADAPNSQRIISITSLVDHFLQKADDNKNYAIIETLSPQAVALCQIKDIRYWRSFLRNEATFKAGLPFLKAFVEQESRLYVIWMQIEELSSEKCKQLPWREYPRWIQVFLAHRAGNLEDAVHLQNICKEMKPEEIRKAKEFLGCYKPYPFELIKIVVDPSLEVQPPVVQLLILKALEHPIQPISLPQQALDISEVRSILDEPSNSLILPQHIWDSLDVREVHNKQARFKLINILSAPACRIALQSWDFNYFNFEQGILPSMAKILQGQEDPEELDRLYNLFFVRDILRWCDKWREKVPSGCADLLVGFEKTPWKLYAALYLRDADMDPEWEGRKEQFPKVCSILERHTEFEKQKKEFRKKLIETGITFNKLTKRVTSGTIHHEFRSSPGWAEVYAQRNSQNVSDFILAFLKNADPRSIALYLKEDELMLFFALFDEKARANLLKARGTSKAFQTLRDVAQKVAESAHLPVEAKQQAVHFITQLNESFSIGRASCPLSKQYNRPNNFSDLTLRVGEEAFLVHQAIVELDPVLTRLLSALPQLPNGPEKAVKETEVKIRLKCLYGVLTFEERTRPEIQEYLKQIQIPSLARLSNPQVGPGVVTLVPADGATFRAHRFILASAFPYFEGKFRSSMEEAHQDKLELPEINADELGAVLDFIYTDELPEFEDDASKHAFERALDRFKPTGVGISIVAAAQKGSQP